VLHFRLGRVSPGKFDNDGDMRPEGGYAGEDDEALADVIECFRCWKEPERYVF